MKRKHWLLFFIALAFVLPAHAGGGLNYYTSLGISPKDAFSLRFGILKNKFGGEIYAKSDIQRLRKDISALDGKTYRLSLMGGFSYRPIYNLMITLNAGYGAKGVYRVDATQTTYGAEDLMTGVEVGLGLHVNFGRSFMLYGGYSALPIGTSDKPYSEFTVGLGFMF